MFMQQTYKFSTFSIFVVLFLFHCTYIEYFIVQSKFISFVKDRPAHDKKYNIDSKKLNKILNFSNSISNFDYSLKKTIDWYLLNKNIYKKKNFFLKRQGIVRN